MIRRRGLIRHGWLVAVTVVLGGSAVVPLAARGERRDTDKIEIHALYEGPTCPSGSGKQPIPGAKLAVTIGGHTIRKRLDDRGFATLEISGSAKEAHAKVTLQDDLLEVDPYGSDDAYSFSDDLKLSKRNRFKVEPSRPDDRGAASAWSILAQGTEVGGAAAQAAGVKLPKVTALYDPGRGPRAGLPDAPGTETHYDSSSHKVLIDSRSRADEFEPWVLLHEYGHHVLDTVADPGPTAAGNHDLEHSYPDQPALPWSEGFAHAFAAIAQNDPVLGTLCRTNVNLSAHPAIPHSVDGDNLNQYHEISIAGALWGLAGRLGGGNLTVGLGKLLGAFRSFHGTYGGPASAAEARDALTEFADQHQTDLQQDIGDTFDDQRMRWGFSLVETSQGSTGDSGGFVYPWARGAFCDENQPGGSGYPITRADDEFFAGPEGYDNGGYYRGAETEVDGPLDYTRHDECWETVQGPYLEENNRYALIQTLPYLPGQAQRNGTTVLGVAFDCVDVQGSCAGASATVTITVGTGIWHRPDGQTYLDSETPLNPKTFTVTAPAVDVYSGGRNGRFLPGDIVPVAKIDAQGNCTTVQGDDCGS